MIDRALGFLGWILYYPLAALAYCYLLIYTAPIIALIIVMWRNIIG